MPTLLPGINAGIVDTADATIGIDPGVVLDGGLLGLIGGPGLTATVPGVAVTNGGTVDSAGVLSLLGATADAVDLTAGGSLSNGLDGAAAIRGTADGVSVTNGAGTVVNGAQGSIDGAAIGVDLRAGGAVANDGGTVQGGTVGVSIAGTAAGATSALRNNGSVSATAADGIGAALDTGALTNGGTIAALAAGGIGVTVGTGTVDNGGTIAGALDGLVETGAAAIDNAGTITGTAGIGVTLAGGDLTNEAAQAITGATAGIAGAAGAVDNLGTITSTAANGVGAALTGGNLTNEAGATLSATGAGGTGVTLAGTGAVINAGTITGTADGTAPAVAVRLGGADSRLVLDAGQTMNGLALATGTGATLEIAADPTGTVARNTLSDVGSTIRGFANVVVDPGVDAEVTGGLAGTAADPLAVSLGDAAKLTLGGPVADAAFDLGGTGTTLTVADPAAFAGSVVDLGTDDTLDIAGAVSATYDPSTGALQVALRNGGTSIIPVTVAAGLDPADLTVTPGDGGLMVGVGTGAGTPVGGTTAGGGTPTTGGGMPTAGGGTITTGGGMPTAGGGTPTIGEDGISPAGTGSGAIATAGSGAAPTGAADTGSAPSTDPVTGAGTATVTPPAGGTATQETGAAPADAISIDPAAHFDGRGRFTITGHVAAASGVRSVTISAVVDGGEPTVLGTARVGADGSYRFLDRVGAHLQAFITATETDGLGQSEAVQSPYSLQAGLRGVGHVAEEDLYTSDGSAELALTGFHRDGSSRVEVRGAGQTFRSNFFDTFDNGGAPNSTFVFDPGHGLDTVNRFRIGGSGHDTLSLPSTDFQNLASVLSNTENTAGGAVITDPTSGDTVRLTGVSKAELRAHPSDFTFHA